MAKKTITESDPSPKTTEADDRLFEESPELLAVESPERDIKPSEVPVREDPESEHLAVAKPRNGLQRFGAWFWRKKWLTIPGLLLIILGILLAIPVTRYATTSWFWKESVTITVTDTGNRQPVSEATVVIAGQTTKTNKDGKAVFAAVPVGDQSVSISKKYYQDASLQVIVPWFAAGKNFDQQLQATGRVVDIAVAHKITGESLANVAISVANEIQSHTDDKGIAHLVIPADKTELAVTLGANGFNTTTTLVKQNDKNAFQLVPTGKIFFLSKQSGNIDVVSTNLDGSDRKVVVEGTGNEENGNTVLLASRDWKYLALKAKREAGKQAALYLIDTNKGELELIDQGKIDLNTIGWSGHHFFYQLYRSDKKLSENGQQAIKSYNADSRKLAIVDESQAVKLDENTQYNQSFSNYYITEQAVVYTKTWGRTGYATYVPEPTDKTSDVVKVNVDGTGKKVLKSYPSQSVSYITAKLYEPQEVFFQINAKDGKQTYAEFEDGKYIEGVNGDKFDSQYPTFLISPNGDQAFWSESRDGKYTMFVGDKNANNKQEITAKSEHQAFGWYTDGYLLTQKGGSELYITTPKQFKAGVAPLKVSDYHRPASFNGYGYGYGGQ